MSWSSYVSYLGVAVLLVLIPGADFTVIVKNTVGGGGRRGAWSAVGVGTSNAVQGLAAVAGLGAVVVHAQPVFQAIKWAGIGYLTYLAIQAFRSAYAAAYPDPSGEPGRRGGPAAHAQARAGWRQGFLSNITNPKVLVFYLAILPQFLGPATPVAVLLLYALSHALLSLAYLVVVVLALGRIRRVLLRRRVRRALDVATGTVLLAFGARLAVERA